MKKRIVITGMGIISPLGIGKDKFFHSLKSGYNGIKRVSSFDTSRLNSHLAGEINDFEPKEILGKKGLRNLDRVTLLGLGASQLALEDSGLNFPFSEDKTDFIGVSLGSTLGSVHSISEFDKAALTDGPRSVNPAYFPNTVINSPASQISIKFNIKGFNSTISSGFCSSLDSIYYSSNMIRLHDYTTVLAGGAEELSEHIFKGFYKIGLLSGSLKNKTELNCPFDKRRTGIVAGEGAALFILEDLENALERSASIYAEILGYGSAFDKKSRNKYNSNADGAVQAIEYALIDSGVSANKIDYICASANSTVACDVMETRAIKKVFGSRAKGIPISSVKSMLGESYSASGGMSLVSAVFAINQDCLSPTINYRESDKRCDLDYVPNESRNKKVDKVLINAFSPTGPNSTLIIGRYE